MVGRLGASEGVSQYLIGELYPYDWTLNREKRINVRLKVNWNAIKAINVHLMVGKR